MIDDLDHNRHIFGQLTSDLSETIRGLRPEVVKLLLHYRSVPNLEPFRIP
jgi:hypothetical protein